MRQLLKNWSLPIVVSAGLHFALMQMGMVGLRATWESKLPASHALQVRLAPLDFNLNAAKENPADPLTPALSVHRIARSQTVAPSPASPLLDASKAGARSLHEATAVLAQARAADGSSVGASHTSSAPQSTQANATADLLWSALQQAREGERDPLTGLRIPHLSAQTRDPVFGPYAESWRHKVERVGALNYPPPVAGRPLQGEVRVRVVVRTDGTVLRIDVPQSSGMLELDGAARHIIQMAAPYQPFTEAMREQADLVEIISTFRFVRSGEVLESR